MMRVENIRPLWPCPLSRPRNPPLRRFHGIKGSLDHAHDIALRLCTASCRRFDKASSRASPENLVNGGTRRSGGGTKTSFISTGGIGLQINTYSRVKWHHSADCAYCDSTPTRRDLLSRSSLQVLSVVDMIKRPC